MDVFLYSDERPQPQINQIFDGALYEAKFYIPFLDLGARLTYHYIANKLIDDRHIIIDLFSAAWPWDVDSMAEYTFCAAQESARQIIIVNSEDFLVDCTSICASFDSPQRQKEVLTSTKISCSVTYLEIHNKK